jgi:glycosyltransferase involved in cell wall biosynthesis
LKLVIQIPAFNEEASLPIALGALPRNLPGFDCVEWLVIDDGSTDQTAAIARLHGADTVISLPHHAGLAAAFCAGLEAALQRGADVIVNTDADNQYVAADIPALLAPLLAGTADVVVGARPIALIASFPPWKKRLQRWGSAVVRVLSETSVADAPSGFRAFNRHAAQRLNVFNRYTYTLETLIQAGQAGLAITSVPIRVNPPLRPSKLMRTPASYVVRSALTLLRMVMIYRPLAFFGTLAVATFAVGFGLGLRFVVAYIAGQGDGKIQSVILAALLMGSGITLGVVAAVTDLIAINRRLLEDVQYRLRRLEHPPRTP